MIDQKQADYFKIRNGSKGCCVDSHINIPRDDMSRLEKIVDEKCSRGYLLTNLDSLLTFCLERY